MCVLFCFQGEQCNIVPDNVDDIVADIAQEEKEEGLCFQYLHQQPGLEVTLLSLIALQTLSKKKKNQRRLHCFLKPKLCLEAFATVAVSHHQPQYGVHGKSRTFSSYFQCLHWRLLPSSVKNEYTFITSLYLEAFFL